MDHLRTKCGRARIGVAGVLSLLCLGAVPTRASLAPSEPAPNHNQPSQPEKRASPSDAPTRIDITFPGGTFGQYLDLVRKAAGESGVNVMVDPGAENVPVRAVELKGVSVGAALSAAANARAPDTPSIVLVTPMEGDEGTVAYYHIQKASSNPWAEARTGQRVSVYSLREIIDPMPGDPMDARLTAPVESVLTAVEAGIAMSSAGDATAEARFHDESGLLFVRGTPEELRAAQEIVKLMLADVRARREAFMAIVSREGNPTSGNAIGTSALADLPSREIEGELRLALVDLERAQMEEHAQRELADQLEARAKVSSGLELAVETRRAHMASEHARLNGEQARIRVDQLRAMLEARQSDQQVEHDNELPLRRAQLDARSESLRTQLEDLMARERAGEAIDPRMIASKQAELQLAKNALADMDREIALLRSGDARVTDLENALAEREREIQRLRAEIDQERASSSNRAVEAAADATRLQVRLEELNRVLDEHRQREKDLVGQMAALTARLAASDAVIQDLRQSREELKTQREKADQDLNVARSTLYFQEQKIAALQREIEALRKQ